MPSVLIAFDLVGHMLTLVSLFDDGWALLEMAVLALAMSNAVLAVAIHKSGR
jgi:hypothetical protein